MQRILVSACLLGEPVRYDGKDNAVEHQLMHTWQLEKRFVAICPELAGGLKTPRTPAEIQSQHLKAAQGVIVKTKAGDDVTEAFLMGAQQALALAQAQQCRFALLAAKSPSCGNDQVYDGRFQHRLIDGAGVTARLLQKNGIQVFNQHQLAQLQLAITEFESFSSNT